MAPVARALVDAGHEVVFATSASFCAAVDRLGFPSVAVGLDWTESEVDAAFPDLVADATDLGDIRQGWRAVFARAAGSAIPDLVRLAATYGADLVLTESLDLAAPLAAEAAGVPHVVIGAGAPRPPALLAAGVGRYWAAARAALGLEDDPSFGRFCPHLYLDPCPPSLHAYPGGHHPVLARPVRPEGRPAADGPLGRLAPGGEPVVYVTMGTVFNRVVDAFAPVLEALAGEAVRVLVTVGQNRDPGSVGAVAPNQRVERYVDDAAVLAQADVVVCHGGFNTTVAALANGVPVIGMPLAADHHYNAFRVASCGAGLTLGPAPVTAALVRRAVRRVLGDPLYRSNASRLQDEIAAMPCPGSAVELMERVAAARLPAAGIPPP